MVTTMPRPKKGEREKIDSTSVRMAVDLVDKVNEMALERGPDGEKLGQAEVMERYREAILADYTAFTARRSKAASAEMEALKTQKKAKG